MRRAGFVLVTVLLAAIGTAGTAAAQAPGPGGGGGGAICGAWEPRGGAGDGFQRFCSEGSLYWFEYR